MTNEQRAEEIIKKYGFDFDTNPKAEIVQLIQNEIENYQEGSSEYIRLLCGYLYCLGDETDVALMENAKYNINMDVGCMIDEEWIESLKNGGIATEYTSSKEEIMDSFIGDYKDFKADDEWW